MYKVGIYLRVRKACFVEGMSVREAARVEQYDADAKDLEEREADLSKSRPF